MEICKSTKKNQNNEKRITKEILENRLKQKKKISTAEKIRTP